VAGARGAKPAYDYAATNLGGSAMVLLLAKVIGTPLLIVFVSLMARRFGPEGAGLLAGLPLASGPVAGLLVAAHGAAFGRSASEGILLGLVGAQAFMVAYALLSPRTAWPLSLGGAFGAFFAIAALAYVTAPPIVVVIPVVVLGIMAIQRVLGPMDRGQPSAATDRGWPDLLSRAVLATLMVVGITAVAPWLGARLSGIIAPIPVATAILSVFTHRTAGHGAVRNLLRGVAGGAYSFWAFFTVLALALARMDTLAAFGLATAAALALQAVRLGARRGRVEEAVPAPSA
jgi:hypothetical protein